MGAGGLMVVNLFALMSTDPAALYVSPDPIGLENDRHIHGAIALAKGSGGMVICGWGTHAESVRKGRAAKIRAICGMVGIEPQALEVNKDGSPKHPLYVGYDKEPKPF